MTLGTFEWFNMNDKRKLGKLDVYRLQSALLNNDRTTFNQG